MTILYKFSLAADGFASIDLPVSSFNYRATAESATGSCIIEGSDYYSQISDRAEGTLTLVKDVDSTETTIFTATITDIGIDIFLIASAVQISFDFEFSGSVASENIEIDNIITGASFQNSLWSFQINEIQDYLQPGIIVEYNELEYYIAEVSASYTGGSFGSVALNEGDNPVISDDTGANCTFDLESGVTASGSFGAPGTCNAYQYVAGGSVTCRKPFKFGHTWVQELSSVPSLFQVMYIQYYNFTLSAESAVSVEVSGASLVDIDDDIYDCSGSYGEIGFEAVLCSGDYSAFENFSDGAFLTFGANSAQLMTLPAGIYTLVVLNIMDVSDTPVAFDIDFEAT